MQESTAAARPSLRFSVDQARSLVLPHLVRIGVPRNVSRVADRLLGFTGPDGVARVSLGELGRQLCTMKGSPMLHRNVRQHIDALRELELLLEGVQGRAWYPWNPNHEQVRPAFVGAGLASMQADGSARIWPQKGAESRDGRFPGHHDSADYRQSEVWRALIRGYVLARAQWHGRVWENVEPSTMPSDAEGAAWCALLLDLRQKLPRMLARPVNDACLKLARTGFLEWMRRHGGLQMHKHPIHLAFADIDRIRGYIFDKWENEAERAERAADEQREKAPPATPLPSPELADVRENVENLIAGLGAGATSRPRAAGGMN
jgi:hypothetical protein